MPVSLASCDMLGFLDELGLDLYAVYLYRYLWNAEVEDKGDAQEGGFGGRKVDLGGKLEV